MGLDLVVIPLGHSSQRVQAAFVRRLRERGERSGEGSRDLLGSRVRRKTERLREPLASEEP